MTKRIAPLVLALGLGAGASLALAEGPAAPATAAPAAPAPQQGKGPMAGKGPMMGGKGAMRHEKPESFTEESVRKMADGRVFKHSVDQKVSEGRFERKEVFTNPEGKTASRTVTATLNKDKNTWTRKVEGVDFDGSTFSRSNDVPVMHGPDGEDEGAAPDAGKRPAAKGGKKAN